MRTRRPVSPAHAIAASIALGLAVAWVSPTAAAALSRRPFSLAPASETAGQGLSSDFSSSDIPILTRLLALSESQGTAVKLLYDGYRARREQVLARVASRYREAQAEYEASNDPAVLRSPELRKLSEAAALECRQLNDQLTTDIRSVLTDGQQSLWPKFERFRFRREQLPNGALSGEDLDLIALVESLHEKAAAAPAITPLLEQYELDLDHALKDRSRDRVALSEKLAHLPPTAPVDEKEKLFAEIRKTGVPVRNLNDRFARLIAQSLPEETQADFNTRFQQAKYPRIYGDLHALRAIDRALADDEITAENKEAIQSLRARYKKNLDAANARWAQAVAAVEAEGGGSRFWRLGMDPSDPKDPVGQGAAERHRLDREVLNKLKALLTDQQRDRVLTGSNDLTDNRRDAR